MEPESVDTDMTWIITKFPLLIGRRHYEAGDVVEVEDGIARRIIDAGHALPHEPTVDRIETATARPRGPKRMAAKITAHTHR